MKHTNDQRGSVSLAAVLLTSFLLSLGGIGSAFHYFHNDPNKFLSDLRTYFQTNVRAEELTALADDSITPQPKADQPLAGTPTDTTTPSPTPTPTPTITGKPSIRGIHGDDDDEQDEDGHLPSRKLDKEKTEDYAGSI